MVYLIAGLILFLGAHSVRIFAERWRREKIAHIGPIKWKALLSLISILGFTLLVVG
ncbi:MAG: NnrU family protein, partial [Burkholderiaceae bacterium]